MSENDCPELERLADADDELDWDVEVQGRMRHFEAADDAVPTVPYERDD